MTTMTDASAATRRGTQPAYEVSVPEQDGRAFRNALGQYGTGVAVITALQGQTPWGMTVNSFAAVSLDPPLVLWSIRNDSSRAPVFVGAEHFAVNVLAAEQMEVARAVATAGSGSETFDSFAWEPGEQGVPLVTGALARLECRLHEVVDGGDHRILVGRVERCSVTDGQPLLFVQGGYATAEALTAPDVETVPGPRMAEQGEPAPFAQLVTAASHRLSRAFDQHRARFGLGVASSRVLKRLGSGPMTLDDLVASCFLGPRAVEDALSELVESSLVRRDGDVWHQTPDGRRVRQQVAESARRFNDQALDGLPEADVAAAHRVLAALARD